MKEKMDQRGDRYLHLFWIQILAILFPLTVKRMSCVVSFVARIVLELFHFSLSNWLLVYLPLTCVCFIYLLGA